MNCIICSKSDIYRVCNKCGARVDARRSLYEWYRAKKAYEREITIKIKKDNENRYSKFDLPNELENRLNSGYYKDFFDNLERQGRKTHGISMQKNGYSPLRGLTKEEYNEYWENFNKEIERIKDNDLVGKIIFHYSEELGEFYMGFDWFDDIIKEYENMRNKNLY